MRAKVVQWFRFLGHGRVLELSYLWEKIVDEMGHTAMHHFEA